MGGSKIADQKELQKEQTYLKETLTIIRQELEQQSASMAEQKKKVIALRQDMWQQTAHSSHDFTKLTEMNQYQATVNSQTTGYLSAAKRVERLERMLPSPYFGRFDFQEHGETPEQIYLGKVNLIDPTSQRIQVYDWRAPIASIFYRYEPGPASYKAPLGEIAGEVLLKRQYKITNSKLEYFFDSSIRITDELLQNILSQNSSPQMRTIVETIQKEQDKIIRDQNNDLLIVQGVAGSGKTSIALHRIAFLLYEGLDAKLDAEQLLIISPSDLFSAYISQVLPELGEEHVRETTFTAIAAKLLKKRCYLESRGEQLEKLVTGQGQLKTIASAYKGSREFIAVLDQLIPFYLKQLPFADLSYGGQLIATRQELKNRFFNSKLKLPPARELKRLKQLLLERVRPLQKESLKRLEKIVNSREEHAFEEKAVSRLLLSKKNKAFHKELDKFTKIDYFELYQLLFSQKELFYRLAAGTKLPTQIDEILEDTRENLERGFLAYEDLAPLLYLKLRLEGSEAFSQIQHVLVDEAQDYDPIHYRIFGLLFPEAKFTVLGDLNQALEKEQSADFYEEVAASLKRPRTLMLSLHRSYRASLELSLFTQKLLPRRQKIEPFQRHGERPRIIAMKGEAELIAVIASELKTHIREGAGTRAVICKNMAEAKEVAAKLEEIVEATLLTEEGGALEGEVVVLPTYLAKGLEFDLVIVYNANQEHYRTSFDQRLLYVACTRALHKLQLYYLGELSPFLAELAERKS